MFQFTVNVVDKRRLCQLGILPHLCPSMTMDTQRKQFIWCFITKCRQWYLSKCSIFFYKWMIKAMWSFYEKGVLKCGIFQHLSQKTQGYITSRYYFVLFLINQSHLTEWRSCYCATYGLGLCLILSVYVPYKNTNILTLDLKFQSFRLWQIIFYYIILVI